MTGATQKDRAAILLRERGIMRLSELKAAGIHYQTMARLADEGSVLRVGRGLYELPASDYSLAHGLAEAAKAMPRGVICLISALQFHELTLQLSPQVWVAIARKDWRPRVKYPPVRAIGFSDRFMAIGIERHQIDKVETRIFEPAKTIVDCFRYRDEVGIDIALEALRNGIRRKKVRPDDVVAYAKYLRIWPVMHPYLDAVLADEG